MNTYRYTVADLSFEVCLPEHIGDRIMEQQYGPFLDMEASPKFSLHIARMEEGADFGELIERYNSEAPFLWLYRRGEEYNVGYSLDTERPLSILSGETLYVRPGVNMSEMDCCINNALMMLYTVACSYNDSLMIHSSVTIFEGGGYSFLGRSGTGKSTHSRLWHENIPGTELLNDDNPVIHLVNGKPYIYGTPWSGKTPCYKNKHVPLRGIVKLSQAPHNKIERLGIIHAFASFMPSCSNIRWDKAASEATTKTITKVVEACPCYHLDCLPDADAALLSAATIAGYQG